MVRAQLDSIFRSVHAPAVARRGSRTEDWDIPDAPSWRLSVSAAPRSQTDRTGNACQQSIYSLPCLRFSHESGQMPRQLPPLNALKAFEAAARSESFTRASEELCATQGDVSHQVKALEATLGIKLFNRERQQRVITAADR